MSNQPELKIRDGALAATIWKNSGEKSDFYSVDFSRTYTDQSSGEVKNTNSFSGAELLRVSRLAEKAYDAIADMRAADKADG